MTMFNQVDSQQASVPAAVFVGDFNTGKSFLINALVRQNVLFISREESLAPPVFLARGAGADPVYAAFPAGAGPGVKSHEQFLGTRKIGGQPCDSRGLAALTPDFPFRHFVLVDTPGASSEENRTAIFAAVPATQNALFVVTTTLEYWPARHTLSLIKEYQVRFPGRFVVVANMADQMNADEIRRVRDKARHRMESHGIAPAPPFFPVSARLEAARRHPDDEYRRRVKPEVRELCDAGFDAFRVALYEFEARTSGEGAVHDLETLLNSPLAAEVMTNQKGQNPC